MITFHVTEFILLKISFIYLFLVKDSSPTVTRRRDLHLSRNGLPSSSPSRQRIIQFEEDNN
jgi:hypothetical protein